MKRPPHRPTDKGRPASTASDPWKQAHPPAPGRGGGRRGRNRSGPNQSEQPGGVDNRQVSRPSRPPAPSRDTEAEVAPDMRDVLREHARPWDEDRTRFEPELILQARTYRTELLFDVPAAPTDPEATASEHLLRSPQGEFAYMNRLWQCGQGIPLLQNRKEGMVYWDDDVTIPVLLNGNDLSVWMSLTPMEVFTLREGISLAKGTVVIGGLGMGYLLRKVCEKTTVERVIVVEQSRELLDWFGHRLCAAQSKVTDVVCGDIYDSIGQFGPDSRYLLDIWPSYGDAVHDEQFQQAKETYPYVWGWGDYRLPGS